MIPASARSLRISTSSRDICRRKKRHVEYTPIPALAMMAVVAATTSSGELGRKLGIKYPRIRRYGICVRGDPSPLSLFGNSQGTWPDTDPLFLCQMSQHLA